MAKQTIGIGSTANDGTGDALRDAFDKVNDNFTEVYADDFITTARIADDSITEAHLSATNTAVDNYVLSFDNASGGFTWVQQFDGDITGIVAGNGLTGDATSGDATLAVGAGTGITVNANDVQIADGGVDTTQLAADSVDGTKIADDSIDSEHIADGSVDLAHLSADSVDGTKIADDSIDSEHYVDGSIDTAHLADDSVTLDKIADAVFVTESEGIGSNDNDTTLPTSAAVKDYVDGQGISALTATDGGFVVGNGSAFVVETGSDARDSIGLGTSGHIQFHCLGIGQAASTVSGQIDATTVYADTFGKDSGDYINWTTDTQMDFYVNGSNEMRLEADGDLHVDGDVIAASTTVSSDERLKENISTYKNAIDTLKNLRGVSFEWKKDGKKSGGVIAQDVEKVLPELVGSKKSLKKDGDETLTVDYNGLIGVLIQAVKELSHKVEKLENR